MIKIIKKMGVLLIALLLLIVLSGFLFVNLSPQFGGTASEKQKAIYIKSDNYKEGKFINQEPVTMDMSLSDMGKSLVGYFSPIPNTVPKNDIEVEKIDSINIQNYQDKTRLVWFGHSTFLLQMDGKKILIDPMFGDVAAPHAWLGTNRFSKELPIEIDKLPAIDAVLISHDHYDHLDYSSIRKLKQKVTFFYVPLGVGAHLMEWGVSKEKIIELDWWGQAQFNNLTFSCTPAQHFSGRGLTDRFNTLWCSWVIQSGSENIFFSGDSGYGPHFKVIGDKYGPFDFAMMECGQYNELWSDIHMFPEETAQAAIDVRAKTVMPIHWGAFKLSLHSWTDPVERVSSSAKELNVNLVIPKIGEDILISNKSNFDSTWWKQQ
ncbi:MAG: MBL fold metallo-hydrolase [Lutimonas sp.]